MNWNKQFRWTQLTAGAKRRWGKLLDEQIDLWSGKRDRAKRVADERARQQFTGDRS